MCDSFPAEVAHELPLCQPCKSLILNGVVQYGQYVFFCFCGRTMASVSVLFQFFTGCKVHVLFLGLPDTRWRKMRSLVIREYFTERHKCFARRKHVNDMVRVQDTARTTRGAQLETSLNSQSSIQLAASSKVAPVVYSECCT